MVIQPSHLKKDNVVSSHTHTYPPTHIYTLTHIHTLGKNTHVVAARFKALSNSKCMGVPDWSKNPPIMAHLPPTLVGDMILFSHPRHGQTTKTHLSSSYTTY